MEENVIIGGIREVVESYIKLKSLGLSQPPTFVINHVAKVFDGEIEGERRNQNENTIISGIRTVYKVFKTLSKNDCEDAPKIFMDNVIEILEQETRSLPSSSTSLPPSPQPQVEGLETAHFNPNAMDETQSIANNTNSIQEETQINGRVNEVEDQRQDQLSSLATTSTNSIRIRKSHKHQGNKDKRMRSIVKLSDLTRLYKCVSCSKILNDNLEWWRHTKLGKCQNSRIECVTCKKSLFHLKLANLLSHESVCKSSLKSYGSGQVKVPRKTTVSPSSTISIPPVSTPPSSTETAPYTLRSTNVDPPNSTAEDPHHVEMNAIIKVEGNPFEPVSMGTKKRKIVRRIYLCHYCQKQLKSFYDLTQHTRIHTGERPFVCTVCNLGFIQKSSLNSHMKKRHRRGSRLNTTNNDLLTMQNNLAQDEDSPPVLSPYGELPSVATWDSPAQILNLNPGEYYDEEDGDEDGDEQDPLQINVEENPDLDPEYDPRSFSPTPISLRSIRHRKGTPRTRNARRKRSNSQGLPCIECGKWCRSRYDLNIHLRVHSNERPYKCPFQFCEATFKCQSSLNGHTRRHQNEDGTFRAVVRR